MTILDFESSNEIGEAEVIECKKHIFFECLPNHPIWRMGFDKCICIGSTLMNVVNVMTYLINCMML